MMTSASVKGSYSVVSVVLSGYIDHYLSIQQHNGIEIKNNVLIPQYIIYRNKLILVSEITHWKIVV